MDWGPIKLIFSSDDTATQPLSTLATRARKTTHAKRPTSEVELGDTVRVGADVSEVTDVPDLSETVTVVDAVRVEVRTGGGAAVAVGD
jgi:hypothetical protein